MPASPNDPVEEWLKAYATDIQARYIDAINAHDGNVARAAKTLGCAPQTLHHAVRACRRKATVAEARRQRLERRAAISPLGTAGFDVSRLTTSYDADGAVKGHWIGERPEAALGVGGEPEGPARDGDDPYVVKGVSTLYGDDGQVRAQWVKTGLDRGLHEQAIREFVAHLVEDARGLSPQISAPPYSDEDLLCVYPLGDPHFGLYAWKDESGDDFNLDIAERVTCAAVDRLVSSAPPAKKALLLNLGDFFHADNGSNQTPGHGHTLDVDTRHAKVMQVGLRAMVYCIKRLAEKHEEVVAWMMPGNHDPHSSFALALALDAFFSNNERVSIDLSPSLFKYMRFGKVLIGSHHGHTAKMRDLPGIMATDRAQDWGATTERHWYCGHIHHKDRDKEHPGVTVETFRTLAPKDAWHAGQGYRSGRDMLCIVHHREFGEWERHRCSAAMIAGPREIA